MGGVHTNANKKNKRFELSKRRLRVEKRKQAGTRVKHLKTAALVAAPARTGKAARLAQRRDRRNAKAALAAQGLLDTQMEQAPKLKAPAAPAAAPSAMQE